jgi:hypothetical protein
VLPWLLEGFGTKVKANSQCVLNFLGHASARYATIHDFRFEQGSDYYFEVECAADGANAEKVCRNTKYGKGKQTLSHLSAPAPEPETGIHSSESSAQEEDAENLDLAADAAADFYSNNNGEL